MGTVYRARDINLNRIVALKLLRKEFSENQEYIEKLETEAKITASVNHPNVVKVFSFGCDYGQYYIAMELVDKGSLDDLMNLQGRIAEVQVLEIGIQAAMGLRAAIQAGLIHRDVKPGNILFADAHTAKIVDFGLAMPLEQAQESEDEIWGTPYYVAPEKLNHDPEDFRSDMYSLGGTLFHALAGRPPFEAENASLVALKHLKSHVVSLQAFAPDISSPTSYVINRTLEKNPNDRYQSYDELIEHLEFARAQLLENSGKPRQPKARVVVEGKEQQEVFGYINMAILAFILILAIVLYVFKDKIISRNMTVQELEAKQVEKGSGAVEQLYIGARKQLAKGDITGALTLLKQLEVRPNMPQPVLNWVLTIEGIAEYLNNSKSHGENAFRQLHSNGLYSFKPEDSKLANYFVDLGRMMTENRPIDTNSGKDFMTEGFEPIGLFAFALKDWDAGDFDAAAAMFQMFISTNPKGPWKWIEEFEPLAKRYLEDYDTYHALGPKLAEATTVDAKEALRGEILGVKAKLKLNGRMRNLLENLTRGSSSKDSLSVIEHPMWSNSDIGGASCKGTTDDASGIFTVQGSGAGIEDKTSDQFYYVCCKVQGDASIVVKVDSTGSGEANAEIGIMLREDLSPECRFVAAVFREQKARFLMRDKERQKSREKGTFSADSSTWLKLTRSGNKFTAFISPDGVTRKSVTEKPQTVSMGSSILAGFVVCSHDNTTLRKAVFSNISVQTSN